MNIADNLVSAFNVGYKIGRQEAIAELVHCKDCVYWQKPQVRLKDGTYRDYEEGEEFPNIEISVGINVGSYCTLYNRYHENNIPQFMNEDDFCSKGSTIY